MTGLVYHEIQVMSDPQRIWTVGHSTHSSEEFLALLRAHQVDAVADVRRFPASRRYSHFNEAEMKRWLARDERGYRWFEALGGRRTPTEDSINTAWRNASFRAYADYMATDEFATAFAELLSHRFSRRCFPPGRRFRWRC